MNKKQFQKYLDRDQQRCWHCGKTGDDLVPQHRRGRGMGGSKSSLTNSPSNILTFCALANGLIESDATLQKQATDYGWKLSKYDDPKTILAFDVYTGSWFLLDDDYRRNLIA